MHHRWAAILAWSSALIACSALPAHGPIQIPEWVTQGPSEPQYMLTAKELCDNGNMTQENWRKYNMDDLVTRWAEQYPNNHHSNWAVKPNANFPNYLADLTGNTGNFQCHVVLGSCSLPDTSNLRECQGGGGGAAITPLIYFAFDAMQNFWDWGHGLQDKLYRDLQKFQSLIEQIVSDFTHPAAGLGSNPLVGAEVVAGGILGTIAAFLGPVGEEAAMAASMFGVGGGVDGGLTGGTLLIQDAQQNAAQILENSFQNQLDDISNLTMAAQHTIDIMSRSIGYMLDGTLNTAPYPGWVHDLNSAPSVLKGGRWTGYISPKKFNAISTEVMSYLRSSAIANLWIQQKVFIVKRSQPIKGTPPCDIKLDALEGARVCDPNTGEAYFFISWKQPTVWPKVTDFTKVPGVKKVGDYGLSLLDMAKSANWMQNTWGPTEKHHAPYIPRLRPFAAYKAMVAGETPNNHFVNLPVVTADDLRPPWQAEYTWVDTDEKYFLKQIWNYVPSLHGWPYHIAPYGHPMAHEKQTTAQQLDLPCPKC